MLLGMTSTWPPPAPPQPLQRWGPTWAIILAWIALVPAALLLYWAVTIFMQGFNPGPMPGMRFILGPSFAFFAVLLALPTILFLIRRGKPVFIMSMSINGLLLLGTAVFAILELLSR